ncbi:MAG: hypothetical protein QF718_08845 [Phycisphaerales bacterium]|nr:hypothetical protein [Phycisphaerales bacterium]
MKSIMPSGNNATRVPCHVDLVGSVAVVVSEVLSLIDAVRFG